jgi:peroxiredoxin
MTTAQSSSTPQIGDRVPDVILSAVDGSGPIHLSNYRGRRLLVFMWASW